MYVFNWFDVLLIVGTSVACAVSVLVSLLYSFHYLIVELLRRIYLCCSLLSYLLFNTGL
jgi:hypothetical protein